MCFAHIEGVFADQNQEVGRLVAYVPAACGISKQTNRKCQTKPNLI